MKQRVEENGFDIWLESSVPEFLPDDIVKQVTPWKKPWVRCWQVLS